MALDLARGPPDRVGDAPDRGLVIARQVLAETGRLGTVGEWAERGGDAHDGPLGVRPAVPAPGLLEDRPSEVASRRDDRAGDPLGPHRPPAGQPLGHDPPPISARSAARMIGATSQSGSSSPAASAASRWHSK